MKSITQVSRLLAMSVKTIRYYDDIGLLGSVSRASNGYRQFTETNIAQLRLIQSARFAGFSIDESKELLTLFNDNNRASKDVKALTRDKISVLKEKINELNNVVKNLEFLHDACAGDEQSQCSILDGLSKKT
ncbi:MAG: MerR family transcriptional regulator [Psychrobium sp.]